MIQSMTQGNPIKLIILFAIPIMLGNLFQQLYIISDMYILSQYLGRHALAVAGAMSPVFLMALFIATGFTNGLCIITAQRFGANDIRGVRKSFGSGLILTIICCLLVISVIQLNMDWIMQKMNIPNDIKTDSIRFLTVMAYAMISTLFYNYFAGIMRALGDSKTPLYFLIFASILNIIINVFLITKLKMDVVGVAWGTGTAQTISVILCAVWLLKKFPILRLYKKDFNVSTSFLMEHLRVAVPMSIQFSIIGLGIIVIQSACNSFGTDTIAAFSAAVRIEQITTLPIFSIGMAVSTYAAQNFGASLIRRIRQGVFQCFILISALSIIMAIIAFKWGPQMAFVFLNSDDSEILEPAVIYLKISTLFYFFLGLIFVFRQALQGMGYPILPLLSGITELVMRGFCAFYLASTMGYLGLCYATPIAWIGGSVIVVGGYLYIIKKYKVSLFGKLNQKTRLKTQ